MVEEKYDEHSGMINMQAAAHLVAKDLGVDLPKNSGSRLQIKNMVAGMRNVNVVGRIFKISPVNEFKKKNGEAGRVVNLFISDGTGYTRIPLWNDQVDMVEDETVKVGDAIQVMNGMSKENIYGEVEVTIGRFGAIRKIDNDESIPDLGSLGKNYFQESNARMNISDLVPGKSEIRGTVVQLFKGKFLFESDGEKGMVVSCVMDDGSDDIRAVFFMDLAENVSGTTAGELEKMEPDARYDLIKKNILGKEIIVSGNVKNNKFFKTLEIVADSVKDLNPLEESKRVAEEIEAQIGA